MRRKIKNIGRRMLSGIAALSLAAASLTPAFSYADEKEDEIKIYTAEDLKNLRENCRLDTWSAGKKVVLEADIDLAGSSFKAIPYFSGTFDGQGHTVTGMTLYEQGSVLGFFRYVGEGAVIRNLNVKGRIEPEGSAAVLGGIAGDNAGSIQNCSFEGRVAGKETAGGIAGRQHESGLISRCVSRGDIAAAHEAGGIAGMNSGRIMASRNEGSVNTEYIEAGEDLKDTLASGLTGGLAGLTSFDISSVREEDFVDIMDIGGIAGRSEGTVSGCVNAGNVGYPHTGYNVGGIVGRQSGYTVNCTNQGTVQGRKDTGGITGQLEVETFWELSEDKKEALRTELTRLNELLDQVFADLADGSGELKKQMNTAAGYADDTIAELDSLTDQVSENLESALSSLPAVLEELKSAYSEENAEAMKTALGRLAEILAEADTDSLKVKADVDGTSKLDIGSVMNSQGDAWWPSLQNWLLQQKAETGAETEALLPAGQNTDGGSGQSPENAEETPAEAQDPGQQEEYVSGGDDTAQEEVSGEGYESGQDETPDDGADVPPEEDVPADEAGAPAEEEVPDDGEEAVYEEEDQDYPADDEDTQDPSFYAGIKPVLSLLSMAKMSVADAAEAVTGGDEETASESGGAGARMNVTESADAGFEGELEADVSVELPDAEEIRSLVTSILTEGASLLDPGALKDALDILKNLEWKAPDTEAFYTAFDNLVNSLAPLAGEVSDIAGTTAADIDALTDQLDVIIDTFFDLSDNISLSDRYHQEDVSGPDPYRSDSSVVEKSSNEGAIEADVNTGGAVGSVSFENDIDAEDVLQLPDHFLKEARYLIFAAVRECRNTGSVTAKKEASGGIAGNMEFGIVTDSVNTGAVSVTEGGYGGGIAGRSDGTINASFSGSRVSGDSYVGGIAGKGSRIGDCISCSYIGRGSEYVGAVAGYADGEVKGCRYVDYGFGGVDNIGYADSAEPLALPAAESEAEAVTESEAEAVIESGAEDAAGSAAESAAESMAESPADGIDAADALQAAGLPEGLLPECHVTFVKNDEVLKVVDVPFGGTLQELPEVEKEGDSFWKWDDFDRERIFSDMTVSGAYYRPVTTLASGGEVPRYLAEGIFYEGKSLTVSRYEGDYPEPEGLKEKLEEKIIRELKDAETFYVNDYEGTLTARVKAESGGTLYVCAPGGEPVETEYVKDGSYLSFPMENGGSFIYYGRSERHKDIRVRIVLVFCAAAAVLIFVRFRAKKAESL